MGSDNSKEPRQQPYAGWENGWSSFRVVAAENYEKEGCFKAEEARKM